MTFSSLGCPQLSYRTLNHSACTWFTNADDYRKLQETAYTNDDDAGLLSVFILMGVYPFTICFHQLVSDAANKHLSSLNPIVVRIFVEFGSAILPLTIVFSTPHTALLALANFVFVCAALAADRENILVWPLRLTRMQATQAVRKKGVYKPALTFLDEAQTMLRICAECRAVVMVTVCIVILAVDFPSVFTRSHVKTQEYGFSIMDLGTGSIVSMTASCGSIRQALRPAGVHKQRSELLLQRLCSVWPLLVVGTGRMLLMRAVDYHVPNSEYGVHWNFFFTLGVISVCSSLANLRPVISAVTGASVLCIYQVVLSKFGVAEYIFHSPRDNLFSANKEGILSCIGYVGMHWFCGICGILAKRAKEDAHGFVRNLTVVGITFSLAAGLLQYCGMPPSRKLCNLPYVLACIGYLCWGVGILGFIDLYWHWPRSPMPLVYSGILSSMAEFFLAANLLTGLINVVFQPLIMPAWAALLTLTVYSFIWSMFAGALQNGGHTVRSLLGRRKPPVKNL